MTTISSNQNKPAATLSNLNLAKQMVFSGIVTGSIHAGLTLFEFSKDYKGTPTTTALFFGLVPAVHNAMLVVFKKLLVDPTCKNNRQIKAQLLIASTTAAFCTPISNTLIYNIFADIFNLKQWEISTIFSQQMTYALYYPTLMAGVNAMTNTVIKNILTAQGLSEDEIATQMSLTQQQQHNLQKHLPIGLKTDK